MKPRTACSVHDEYHDLGVVQYANQCFVLEKNKPQIRVSGCNDHFSCKYLDSHVLRIRLLIYVWEYLAVMAVISVFFIPLKVARLRYAWCI